MDVCKHGRLRCSECDHIRELEEKVSELEEEIERTDNSFANAYMQYQKQYERAKELEEENQRYKEVLEFYANPQIWKEGKRITDNRYEMPLAYNDNGEKARQALKGEST
ncbi:hypothetical protein [Oceanobacillus sp. FSL W7-1281]|uniref:hypothetical protein n=1 Tax=Oceanobacillus sp. FSL W7-1281 TaxID=2921698 RepID=UPI0030D74369